VGSSITHFCMVAGMFGEHIWVGMGKGIGVR
jgi:hypothetical protein